MERGLPSSITNWIKWRNWIVLMLVWPLERLDDSTEWVRSSSDQLTPKPAQGFGGTSPAGWDIVDALWDGGFDQDTKGRWNQCWLD